MKADTKDDLQLFAAIGGAGFSPLVVALPFMAATGGAPLWLTIAAVVFAVVALAWTALTIKRALQWTP